MRLLDRLKIATGEKGKLDRELTRLTLSHRQLLASLPQAAAAAAAAVGETTGATAASRPAPIASTARPQHARDGDIVLGTL